MITTGHIYKIICRVDQRFCYIGSTFDTLHRRFKQHIKHYNKWIKGEKCKISCFPYFEKYGIENFDIILIKSYEVYRENHRDTKHLRAYETLWFNKSFCVNQYIPIEYLRKEKKKQYREDNKEDIAERKKEYRENNKEKITEYLEKNKEKLKEYRKEYCENNKEKINEQRKKWRDNNKEKIKEQKKKWRDNNKEKISTYKNEKIKCAFCNSFTVRSSMLRHQKSNKCKTYQVNSVK